MMKLALSPAAAGLLRSLLARAGVDRDRILLTEFRSVDWQSLTFMGERHEMELRVPGPDASAPVDRLTVEFQLCNPDVAFLSKVAFSAFAIDDSEYLEAHAADPRPQTELTRFAVVARLG